ncbi:UNVERIFIED_CONTAM: hypothetical protein HDU68_005257 [Siphonaria sp. JEL0065]|nr:hypothetical protein HDU68_005257 [Siphonaria sp. JEL0065]
MVTDSETISQLFAAVATPKTGRQKYNSVKAVNYILDGITVTSFNCPDAMYRKGTLPTMARGLFVLKDSPDRKVLIRGYDKFFNIGETPATTLDALKTHTHGPYEMSVKENGCIIFATGFNGKLVVSSKHALYAPLASTGEIQKGDGEGKITHSQKGEEWAEVHLAKVGKTKADLADFLEVNNVTAVFELADDDFEEHILEYPEDRRGLYLHGINKNSCQLETWSTERVKQVGLDYGFFNVETEIKDSFEDVMLLADKCRVTGSYQKKPVEGFVVRCTSTSTESCFMFKIKYDEPYLMFREWREITNLLIHGRSPTARYRLSETYISWCEKKLVTDPDMFEGFLKHKGIIAARNLFLHEHNIQEFGYLLNEATKTLMVEATANSKSRTESSSSTNNDINSHAAIPPSLIEFPTRVPPAADLSLAGSDKILILPIAIVGQGKSTLGSALMSQYYSVISHVQSDAHKKKAGFLKAVMLALEKKNVVYVDRNNHLDIHRTEVSRMFREKYPGGRILAVEWDVKGPLRGNAVKLSIERIQLRGEMHQKLTPEKTPGYEKITADFFRDFTPIDRAAGSLDVQAIDALVKIPLDSSLSERVRIVADAMSWRVDEAKLAERQAKVDAGVSEAC